MTDSLHVLLCAPETESAYSVDDIQVIKDTLSGALDGASVGFCAVDPKGQSLLNDLKNIDAGGSQKTVVAPVTPFAGDMQKRLIPSVLAQTSNDIELARDAGVDPAMLRAARVRVEAALAANGEPIVAQDSLLMIVGQGSIDTDSNGNLMKMARMIWEGLGFAWAEVAFVSGAFPSIEQSLERGARLGFKSIVVLPYVILRDGAIDALSDRISGALGEEDTNVVIAEPLGAEDHVVQTLAARVHEAIAGQAMSVMNCQLCTYREQVLALESHDHHDHDHTHGHDHHHDD